MTANTDSIPNRLRFVYQHRVKYKKESTVQYSLLRVDKVDTLVEDEASSSTKLQEYLRTALPHTNILESEAIFRQPRFMQRLESLD